MAKHRDLKLEKYNISRSRYRELYYFCLQYDERKKEMEELRYPSPPKSDGMPRGSTTSNPTERNGMRAARLAMENQIMEQAAAESACELAPWILKAAKYDLKFNYLHLCEGMPCGKNEFQKLRHKFYYILDQKKREL
jgi:hypothetical protein